MLDVVSVQSRAKSKATKCSKIQCEKHAIAHCMKCELFMCETCLEFHGSWPAFAKHTVLSISELTKAASKNHAMLRGKPRCSKHESKVLKFYCQTCGKLVCRYCIDFDHAKQNHLCVPVEDVADEKRQSFKTSVDSLEDKLKKESEALETVTNVTQLLKENLDKAKCGVNLHKQEILSHLWIFLRTSLRLEIWTAFCLRKEWLNRPLRNWTRTEIGQTGKPVTDGNIQYKRDTISVERLTELCNDLLGVAGKRNMEFSWGLLRLEGLSEREMFHSSANDLCLKRECVVGSF